MQSVETQKQQAAKEKMVERAYGPLATKLMLAQPLNELEVMELQVLHQGQTSRQGEQSDE